MIILWKSINRLASTSSYVWDNAQNQVSAQYVMILLRFVLHFARCNRFFRKYFPELAVELLLFRSWNRWANPLSLQNGPFMSALRSSNTPSGCFPQFSRDVKQFYSCSMRFCKMLCSPPPVLWFRDPDLLHLFRFSVCWILTLQWLHC